MPSSTLIPFLGGLGSLINPFKQKRAPFLSLGYWAAWSRVPYNVASPKKGGLVLSDMGSFPKFVVPLWVAFFKRFRV